MPDVLSQNEIDELLSALNSGEVDVADMDSNKKSKQIKEYNFARPSKFSKEQLRTLEIIFDNYGRQLLIQNLQILLRILLSYLL